MSSALRTIGPALVSFTILLSGAATPKGEDLYGRLSAAFEASGDGFVSRLPGAQLRVSATRAELHSLAGAFRMKPGGARATCGEGLDRLPGVSNYHIGKDPGRWRLGVPAYARGLGS